MDNQKAARSRRPVEQASEQASEQSAGRRRTPQSPKSPPTTGHTAKSTEASRTKDEHEADTGVDGFTFYREGTPPPRTPPVSQPPDYASAKKLGSRWEKEGPGLDLPAAAYQERVSRPERRWAITLVAAAVFLVALVAIGVGVGVAVGRSSTRESSR